MRLIPRAVNGGMRLGYGTTGLSVGQRVFGMAVLIRDSTLAEDVAVEARNLAPAGGRPLHRGRELPIRTNHETSRRARLYGGVASGEPLFARPSIIDSRTGWPSFSAQEGAG